MLACMDRRGRHHITLVLVDHVGKVLTQALFEAFSAIDVTSCSIEISICSYDYAPYTQLSSTIPR